MWDGGPPLWLLLAFLATGWGLFLAGGVAVWRARRALSWPTTSGRVLRSALKISRDAEGETRSVEVRYAYEVDGRAYESSRIAFGYAGGLGTEYQMRIHEKLPEGARVAVRYDPANPKRATLSAGAHSAAWVLLTAGGLFGCVGLMAWERTVFGWLAAGFFVAFFAQFLVPSAFRDELANRIEVLEASPGSE